MEEALASMQVHRETRKTKTGRLLQKTKGNWHATVCERLTHERVDTCDANCHSEK